MTLYGSSVCPRTQKALAELDAKGIPYKFRNFCEDIAYLKEFLVLRDKDPLFTQAKADGRIGIPCFILQGGHMTLDLDKAITSHTP